MDALASPVSTMQRLQLDERLRPFHVLRSEPPPSGGWLRTIREALGMTARQLARRTGVNSSTIIKAERAEAAGTASLKTLRRVADALDCDVVYVIVPRTTLQATVINRAIEKATAEVSRVAHTMALEKQTPTNQARKSMIEARVQELMAGSPRRLWEDD